MNDHHEVGDSKPTRLSQLIGQKAVLDQVAVAIDAARADERRLDHALLAGPPGLGKTALAQVAAAEMETELHEVLGQAITNPADLNGLLLGAKDRDVVHIDEAHELPKEQQTALYLALDQRRILIGSRAGKTPHSIPLGDFTLLLSTTDEYALLQPLRDRMRLLLRFQFYDPDELVEVLRQRIRSLGWDVERAVLPLIAERSRGTPRMALRLLQSCRRVARSKNRTAIKADHLEQACRLEQLDALGLGPTERQYLQAIADGAARLNVLASLLGLPARTVSSVTEPFLIRSGLICKDDAGRRELTAKGREHLAVGVG